MALIDEKAVRDDMNKTFTDAKDLFHDGKQILIAFHNRMADKSVDIKSFANTLPALLETLMDINKSIFEMERYMLRSLGKDIMPGSPEQKTPQDKRVETTNIYNVSEALKNRSDKIKVAGAKAAVGARK